MQRVFIDLASSFFLSAVCLINSLLFVNLFGAGMAKAADAKPASDAEWEKTVKAAKKEGQVVFYSTSGAALRAEPFQKAYPEIKYTTVTITPPQLAQRVMSERRAGKYLVDVVSTGANPNYQVFYHAKILEPIRAAFLLPEVLDKSLWWQGKHLYVDPEGEYVLVYFGNVARVASHNTKLVKPAEFKSYWDFLNSKWKGKIVARDIRRPGSGGDTMRFFYANPELGPSFIRKLFAEAEMTLVADSRQGVDWVAQGKYSLGLFFGDVDIAKAQGLPVDELDPHLFKEGAPLGVGNGTLTLMRDAPHPNAAKVFINWLLSREGQLTVQKEAARGGTGTDSMRIDIPKDDVPLSYRRRERAHYIFVGRHELTDMGPIYRVVNEALAERKK